MWLLLLLVVVAITVIFSVKSIRVNLISRPAFAFFKRVLPPLSSTEREAMEAGDTWWEAQLFSGKPKWEDLHGYRGAELTTQEKMFIDNEVKTLLGMLDDYQMVEDGDMPEAVWSYMRRNGFFSLIIPKEYGGKAFSAFANSTIVSMIAARSLSAGVVVMVPNSLGPGELLSHYGTKAQQDYWLPRLAKGDEVPCFALTGPKAGSDAGAIPDIGVVCEQQFEGKMTLGIKLNWEKRYITLAPKATVIGLAFKLTDPDGLIGQTKNIGITCALIPADHEGVQPATAHNPLNMAFPNGTTRGKDVFIPMDWVIGGQDYVGRGWRMLVECLSAGRGISLPALATATSHMALKTTTAYCHIREQFSMPIEGFEGIQEAMARLVANTYQLEAGRRLTTTALDLGVKPSVVTAMAKYHMTEMGRQSINDAMDIQAGKGIQLGVNNYLANHYTASPVSITVEGANILTRSLMIFGQGATRCHPYVLAEMEAAAMEDSKAGLDQFDGLLMKHIVYASRNALKSLGCALTASRFNHAPLAGPTAKYYRDISRLSSSLAIISDISMLVLGGDLKRKEMYSAKLGDALSNLYFATAALKWFEDNGHQQQELPIIHYVMQQRLQGVAAALQGAIRNFPNRVVRIGLKGLIFPLGNHFEGPSDQLAQEVVACVAGNSTVRQRLTSLCPDLVGKETGIEAVEQAYLAKLACAKPLAILKGAVKAGKLDKKLSNQAKVEAALAQGLIDDSVAEQLHAMYAKVDAAIMVDEFPINEVPVQAAKLA